MTEETLDELQELGMQILVTALIAISSVLTQSAINKIRYGHITNYPSRSTRTQSRKRSIYDEDDEYDENNFHINFDDD